MTSFGFTVNCCALEVPPPGAGFVTVILNVPAVARSVAGIAAVSCVALTKVVVRAEPLKFTVELETKFVPFTVSGKAASVTDLLVGEMLAVVGVALFTVNTCALDVPPPGAGFVTVMLNVPAVVRSLPGMEAVTLVELTKVAVPIVVAPCFTVNVTVPSFTVAVDVLFAVTFEVRFALPPVVPLAFPTIVVVSALLTVSVPAVAAELVLKFGVVAAGL